jgi:4-alpha-glucanotransferase
LLHITSLPSPFGIGDLGPEAHRFVDFLHQSGQAYWQVLPVNPIDLARAGSPYVSDSAFAGNPLLISPDGLVDLGLIGDADLDEYRIETPAVDFHHAAKAKSDLLNRAFIKFQNEGQNLIFEKFCMENAFWLDDFALFSAFKHHHQGRPWHEWPDPIRFRDRSAIKDLACDLTEEVQRRKFEQFVFDLQWQRLRWHCRRRAISVLGDMPIYVHYDSADVWAHPEIFKLDGARRPWVVAGVPPDYFSETGQLWGNPLYNWDVLAQNDYLWWVERFKRTLNLMDFVRIDHFRGLVSYWEVPVEETTAINGRWVEAPVWDFLRRLCRVFPVLPFLAEDLGLITPDVIQVINHFELPGMKVLLFAFGDDVARNPFTPHNHVKNCVVYTGTHDNNTVRGWFEHEAPPDTLDRLAKYIGRTLTADQVAEQFIRMAMGSVAYTAIIPMQDIIGLGQNARLNVPGTTTGNWTWRMDRGAAGSDQAQRLRDITRLYGRTL